jgi:hypothetical protein
LQRSVTAPTLAYDTTQVTSPIISGTFEARPQRHGVPQPGWQQDGRRR